MMTFLSYAQNFEDVLLWRALKDVHSGFYIDVGAQHPDVDSVTRAFYDRGWSGINVEPVPASAMRLREARPRDVTLEMALGAQSGNAAFYVVEGTGLSTMDTTARSRAGEHGFPSFEIKTPVKTLAEICREHVRGPVHFLKVDVEGSEAAVLAGADFSACRPWVVLVEATTPLSGEPNHAEWQDALLAAHYHFAWFDGLNRFYVADERAELLDAFKVPPNVGDNFLRVADVEWASRLAAAEARADTVQRMVLDADRRRTAAEESCQRAHLVLATETARRATAESRAAASEATLAAQIAAATSVHDALRRSLDAERAEAVVDRAWLQAMRRSTSWRLTSPLRWFGAVAGSVRGRPAVAAAPSPDRQTGEAVPDRDGDQSDLARCTRATSARPPLRTVHQFHSGSATGDAVTNALLLTRSMLRGMGYRSDIFVEHRDPALAHELLTLDELPLHADYVLMIHHSIGHDQLDRLLAVPAPKILYYHNITPPEWLSGHTASYARLGRDQLKRLAPHVSAALANSEFTATELRRAGFSPVSACPLLFDPAALSGRVRPPSTGSKPFTVLFVGRMIASKGQRDLVDAFAEFNRAWAAPARLVLVGANGGPDEPYCASVLEAIRRNQLDGQVVVTGPVSDAELRDWYSCADLYVSLSQHEGFGVPLIEAVAWGVPVLAWPAGAVAETIGEAGVLLSSCMPTRVGGEMLDLARDTRRLRALTEVGRASLARFSLDHQRPKLAVALARAGAAPPADRGAGDKLAHSLRYTVAGHVNGTYSLAAININLALTLDAERPERVRVLPVEAGEPSSELGQVQPRRRAALSRLAGRPAFATGPEIVISQHYPVYVPPVPGDVTLALFFWEESLVPARTVAVLNDSFNGVLAPSRFVAKALLDSGVHVPIRVLPLAPPLQDFEAIALTKSPRPPGRSFTFLHVSSCFPRKGVDVLLQAYAQAFRAGDDVRLVIKGVANIHNDVAEQIAALSARDPDHAEIEFNNEDLPDEALLQLYRQADAMVLPSRGEGFNLPAAEAMAAGIPLIVTDFGGHLDFCTAAEARLIKSRFAASCSHLATPGSVWAEPCVDDLAAALCEIVADPAAGVARASLARSRIALLAEPGRLAATLDRVALDVLLQAPAEPLRVALVSSWGVRCGVAEYARQLIENMPTDGIGSVVVLADDRPALGQDRWKTRRVWRQGDADSIPTLARAIAEEEPHALVVQHQPGLLSWGHLAALLQHPVVQRTACLVTLHNTAHLLEQSRDEQAQVRRALASASRVVVHTIADLNRLRNFGLCDNVVLLPHGAKSPRPRRPARRVSAEDDVLIGSYGFFLPGKGLPELIGGFQSLCERWPMARLRLVNASYGSVESKQEIALCRRLANAAGFADRVEFHTEFLTEARSLDLLSACDLVVLPYQPSAEASSAAVRSALAAGSPVAVSPVAIFDEAGSAVARLPGMDQHAIAAGVARLLADTDARDALTAAAEVWMGERSWTRVATRFAGIVRGVTREPRERGRQWPERAIDADPGTTATGELAVAAYTE